jgi:RHS repeat-associated protein
MRRIIFFLIAFTPLLADLKDPEIQAATDGDPEMVVSQHVNILTGDFVSVEEDYVVSGVEPIPLRRIYVSGDGRGADGGWEFFPHTQMMLFLKHEKYDHERHLVVAEPSGSRFTYHLEGKRKGHQSTYRIDLERYGKGITNTSRGAISGRTNYKNNRIDRLESDRFRMQCSNGDERFYTFRREGYDRKPNRHDLFLLEHERLANRNRVFYEYDGDDRVTFIKTTDPSGNKTYAWAKFTYAASAKKNHNFLVETSDGQRVEYIFHPEDERKRTPPRLALVKSTVAPDKIVEYRDSTENCAPIVKNEQLPLSRGIFVEYYGPKDNDVGGTRVTLLGDDDIRCDRVKTLHAPVGPNGEKVLTHRFFYDISAKKKKGGRRKYTDNGATEIYDALGCKTKVRFSEMYYPSTFETYDEKGVLLHSLKMDWFEESDKQGELWGKTLRDGAGQEIWRRSFDYDGNKNVVKESFFGDLRGLGKREEWSKWIQYNDNNLPSCIDEDGGSITYITYLGRTPLIASKIVCGREKPVLREFNVYDADNLLKETISDDGTTHDKDNLTGVTVRKVVRIERRQAAPAFGFPEKVKEFYIDVSSGREVLLRETVFTYRSDNKKIRTDVIDGSGALRYTLHTEYDSMGRIAAESDPFGKWKRVDYDPLGNPVRVSQLDGRTVKQMSYDNADRCRTVKEVGSDGSLKTSRFEYDLKHRQISATDTYENVTLTRLSPAGTHREVEHPQTFPWHLKTKAILDGIGREISRTDTRGETTVTTYTSYNKPKRIQHPDGTEEKFVYTLDGKLKEHTDGRGITTQFTYDALGHEVAKKISDKGGQLLLEEKSEYKGNLLVRTVDGRGHSTTFAYDGAGRKILEQDQFHKIEYTYDALGRQATEKRTDGAATLLTVRDYDLLDRVTEERCEGGDGAVLWREKYGYDSAGNQTTVARFIGGKESVEQTTYDTFDREVAVRDALGHTTTISYDERTTNEQGQRILVTTQIDPRGVATIERHDPLGRVTATEKRSSGGKIVSHERMEYDRGGNVSKHESTLISKSRKARMITTLWEYGVMNRLMARTEAAGSSDQRLTRYSYKEGLLDTITKPDGVKLQHLYDSLGRKVRFTSSDGSVDYGYSYDPLGAITQIEDHVRKKKVERVCDARGRQVEEVLESGFKLAHTYDGFDRKLTTTFPDTTSIGYAYDGLYLRSVARYSPLGQALYSHLYNAYDQAGNCLAENDGWIQRSYDLLGRPTRLSSPIGSQTIDSYDAVGNILQRTDALPGKKGTHTFTYDELSQLMTEPGHLYAYDSHNNRETKDQASYTHNARNELVKAGEVTFTYDLNGNPTTQKNGAATTTYTYDALDRLIQVQTPNLKIGYTYDGFHRRTTQSRSINKNGAWTLYDQHYFLYDDQNDIGATTPDGKLFQLRILGNTGRAEAGSAIALEVDGEIYQPYHDLFGNTIAITETNALIESYSYTAFGEESNGSTINPWRFSSKRTDPDTHLIYYGRRYYDPALGRWLTPDPKGYTALSSLYAFCLNNPLTLFDLYGLEPIRGEPILNAVTGSRPLWTTCHSPYDYAVTGIGLGLYRTATQLPIPYIRRGGMSLGNSMMRHGSGQYIGQTEFPSTAFTMGSGHAYPNHRFLYVNGINTKAKEALRVCQDWSRTMKNTQVDLYYNSSRGVINDLGEAGAQLSHLPTHAQWGYTQRVNEIISELGGPASGGKIHLMTHSQGCIIAAHDLAARSIVERQMFDATTFGTPKFFHEKGLQVKHFASNRDPVTLADPIGYVHCLNDGSATILPTQGSKWWIDHSIDGPTYKPVMEKMWDDWSNDLNKRNQ